MVIICRLPFRVPTDPVVQARVEAITRKGEDAFTSYSLPQAVIRFRQGFGRLIRSGNDRGVVAVLDSRIARRGYGSVFLASVPETERVVADRATVLSRVAAFLSR